MNTGKNFSEVVDLIKSEDTRYAKNAYYFVRQALDHTLRNRGEDGESRQDENHVSGEELLSGIREYALNQFGPMTFLLLENWNIRSCADFGEIVFNLVEYGVLGKTEHDSREDFRNGYDFKEAFVTPFLPKRQWKPATPLMEERDNRCD